MLHPVYQRYNEDINDSVQTFTAAKCLSSDMTINNHGSLVVGIKYTRTFQLQLITTSIRAN